MGSPTRPKTLKRTISKCGIDAGNFMSDFGVSVIAPKKLAPLHDSRPDGFSQQHAYYDVGEPVLLPRHDRSMMQQSNSGSFGAVNGNGGAYGTRLPEMSSEVPFGWDGSPAAMKNRYYESVMDSANMTSPSPHHAMYPYSPMDGTASTVSMDLNMFTPQSADYAMYPTHGGYEGSMQHAPQSPLLVQERDFVTAANLHAVMVDYLQEVFMYYQRAKAFTFGQLAQMVRSVPFGFRYIQGLVKNRLGIPWHLVGAFVENVLEFIRDEDIREATVYEFADFLRSAQQTLYDQMPPSNIFANLCAFFQSVLERFKKYLVAVWLETKRIEFPCEFGKKSTTLFLCMECHREHL
ncbi:hypothetical protein Poli38472_009176 [Pythium oligandrum]|uniref:Uncharacterized protein n=1 Tax=Pythium oligandrum TaxID=41045 RepID=A0A8K1FL88_PYTOL|nr:hypothetical protein Poli38472_009176 [Pythium oligandrum]|eukprot:TMW65009.1 hypothetical protein Poli38472_009176 [Pythium oligandrum]